MFYNENETNKRIIVSALSKVSIIIYLIIFIASQHISPTTADFSNQTTYSGKLSAAERFSDENVDKPLSEETVNKSTTEKEVKEDKDDSDIDEVSEDAEKEHEDVKSEENKKEQEEDIEKEREIDEGVCQEFPNTQVEQTEESVSDEEVEINDNAGC